MHAFEQAALKAFSEGQTLGQLSRALREVWSAYADKELEADNA